MLPPDPGGGLDAAGMTRLGQALGELARPGDILCLEGGLGAGKTFLAQAIARGLGVPATVPVTSPTFAIIQDYPGRIPLYHVDLYRLHGADDIEATGLLDCLYGEGLSVVEWPERFGSLLPEKRLHLLIAGEGDGLRRVSASDHGGQWRLRLQQRALAALVRR